LDRYRAIKAKLTPLTLNTVDRSARAYECLAEGPVLRANRAIPAAAEQFREAFEIFDAVGYRWRAATGPRFLSPSSFSVRSKWITCDEKPLSVPTHGWNVGPLPYVRMTR